MVILRLQRALEKQKKSNSVKREDIQRLTQDVERYKEQLQQLNQEQIDDAKEFTENMDDSQQEHKQLEEKLSKNAHENDILKENIVKISDIVAKQQDKHRNLKRHTTKQRNAYRALQALLEDAQQEIMTLRKSLNETKENEHEVTAKIIDFLGQTKDRTVR